MTQLRVVLVETREELGIIQQALAEHTPYEDVAIIADDAMIRDVTREMLVQVEEAALNSPHQWSLIRMCRHHRSQ